MSLDNDILGKFYRDLEGLPKPEPKIPAPLIDAPEGCCRCACGKKFIPLTEVQQHHTGILTASDTECKECLPAHKDFALIVCLECKAVVAKMAPTKYSGGFELKSNQCYHVGKCQACQPGIEKSYLLEKYLYDKEQGHSVPPMEDVLPSKSLII